MESNIVVARNLWPKMAQWWDATWPTCAPGARCHPASLHPHPIGLKLAESGCGPKPKFLRPYNDYLFVLVSCYQQTQKTKRTVGLDTIHTFVFKKVQDLYGNCIIKSRVYIVCPMTFLITCTFFMYTCVKEGRYSR